MKRIILLMAVASLLSGASAWAADTSASVDINSAYVWRGMTINDGAVVQPSLTVSKGGFGLNVWGNFDLADYHDTVDKNNFSEIDITPSYSLTFDKLSVSVGLIEYLFPAGGPGTREVYTSLGYSIIDGLSAGFDFYYDVDEVHGIYSDLSLSYSMDLMDKLSASVGGKVGYANKDYAEGYGGTDDGWYNYDLMVGATYKLSDALSVGANIHYTDNFDKKVLPNASLPHTDPGLNVLGQDTKVYGGVNITYAF